jgi:hypothetical protein
MFASCDRCQKRYDVTGKRPGASFKCPACKEGTLTVPSAPAAEPELELLDDAALVEEPAAQPVAQPAARREPGAPRAERAGRRQPGARNAAADRAKPGKAGGMNPLVLGIVGVLVLGGAAAFVFSGKDDPAPTPPVVANSGVGSGSAATSGKDAGSAPIAADPRTEYQNRAAKLAKKDARGRAELAEFCERNAMKTEARQLRREALLLDPDDAMARAALGFQRYEGKVEHLRGRWLDAADQARAVAAEKYYSAGALSKSASSHDVFVRNCEDAKKRMLEEFPEDKWFYAYGKELMPQPFFVLIQRPKDPSKLEDHRREYAEILAALYDVFFDRYEQRFKLERDIESVIRVLMFDSVQAYEAHRASDKERENRYTPSAGVGGYYMNSEKLLVMWRGGMDIRQVLFHEGTHLFVAYAFGGKGFQDSRQSPWLQEGIAELFAGHKIVEETIDGVKQKRYVLNQFIPHRYGSYRQLLDLGLGISVLDLCKLDVYTFREAQKKAAEDAEASLVFGRVYAFGWVLCMYLNHAENGKYRNVLDDYLEAETKGEGYWQKLGELLGLKDDDDWAAFDERVRKFAIDELPKFK